jgi:tetratricopeptide (TPR) repeat protein
VLFHRGDYDKALTTLQEAQKSYRTAGLPLSADELMSDVGNIYFDQMKVEAALQAYYGALKVAHDSGDLEAEAMILNNIARAQSLTGAPSLALGAITRAVGLARIANMPELQCTSYSNLGAVYQNLLRLEDALEAYKTALEFVAARRCRGHHIIENIGREAKRSYEAQDIAGTSKFLQDAIRMLLRAGFVDWAKHMELVRLCVTGQKDCEKTDSGFAVFGDDDVDLSPYLKELINDKGPKN